MKKDSKEEVVIDPLSSHSLIIWPIGNGQLLGSATGFTIERNGKFYLVTNWHVVTGRDSNTNEPLDEKLRIPDALKIPFHVKNKVGVWLMKQKAFALYDSKGNLLWLEHADGRKCDVVILPLENIDKRMVIYPLDLTLADADVVLQPSMPVSVIGFPLGMAVSNKNLWPIWKTGHIACDHDLNFNDKPAFLIDASTRGGMSGSPVILKSYGPYKGKNGNFVLGKIVTRFLGIYSGRVGSLKHNSDIGIVWKPNVISEIFEANNL